MQSDLSVQTWISGRIMEQVQAEETLLWEELECCTVELSQDHLCPFCLKILFAGVLSLTTILLRHFRCKGSEYPESSFYRYFW